MKHIVIAGGGFAGIRLARKLRKFTDEITVTLINNSDDFRYSPALYRVASGVKMGVARIPIEWMLLDSENVNFVQGTVKKLNSKQKFFLLEDGRKVSYDYAVCSMGMVTTYFGIDGIGEHSFGVKSIEEIEQLRHHIHESVVVKRKKVQNYVVIGAGPTGVEVAANLGTYIQSIKAKHKLKSASAKVYLVEAAPRVLQQMSEKASQLAMKELKKRGVTVMTNTKVTSETSRSLRTSEGNILTDNVIWTAGMANNPFYAENEKDFTIVERGRIAVDGHLCASKDVYVAGDNASTRFSGLAYTAVAQADFIASDIMRRIHGRKRPTHADPYPPQVVPVGKTSILQYRSITVGGWPVNIVRRLADLVGYSDVLGLSRALTIWKNRERIDEPSCAKCRV